MAIENCSACADLRDKAPETIKGITEAACASLGEDTGLNPNIDPLSDNCTDLQLLSDCFYNTLATKLRTADDCDWKDFVKMLLSNDKVFKDALVCNECGQWKWIWELLRRIDELESIVYPDGFLTVTKVHRYTVPVEKFVTTTGSNTVWWSGSTATGESYIQIPVSEMDIVDAVVAQPRVVGNRVHAVTVAIQTAERVGDTYHVNFDTYEIQGDNGNYPFAVPIDFVVTGRKRIR